MTERLYIKVDENNVFIDHPHFESNVRQLYPNHNFESGCPEGWVEFERSAPPSLGAYEKFDETKGGNIANAFSHNGLEYAFVDGKYKDVWHVLKMTDEEKQSKISNYKEEWADENPGVTSWTFNEELCQYEPPVPYPDSPKDELRTLYIWDEPSLSWILAVSEEEQTNE